MRIINEAYTVLGDPDRRMAYDRELAAREQQTPKVPGPSASAPEQSTAAARDGSAGVEPSPAARRRQTAYDTAPASHAQTKSVGSRVRPSLH